MHSFLVRRATRSDSRGIAQLLKIAFSSYQAMYTLEAFQHTIIDANKVEERLLEGPIWVSERDDAIVGTVSAKPEFSSLKIRGMAVSPNARRAGAASDLLDACEAFAVQNGYRSLTLETTPFLTAAIRLYERAGFKIASPISASFFGTPIFAMKKRLEPPH